MTSTLERPAPIIVTDNAAKRIEAVLAAEDRPGLRLRVAVSGGGCSGFQYNFDLDDKEEPGDVTVQKNGATIVVDGMSLMYVLGAQLDFIEDMTGSYFRMSNPNAASSCGCGNSFAI